MNKLTLAVFAVSVCVPLVPVSASPVSGFATVNGSGIITLTDTSISFGTAASNAFAAGLYNSGDFASETGGSITNLSNIVAGAGVNDPVFAVLNTDSGPISFDLASVLPGLGTAAGCDASAPLGSVCTPGGSPYLLIGTSSTSGQAGTLVQFSLAGSAYLGSSSTGASPAIFTFETLVSSPLNTVLNDLATGVQAPGYGAALTSLAPEPAGIGLAAAGLIILTGLLRRRRQ